MNERYGYDLAPGVPTRGNAFTRFVFRGLMRLSGWRFAGERFPEARKFVVIVGPHTSNWDFCVGVMAMYAIGFRAAFLGKDSLFRFPLGIAMRFLGGTPVDRANASDAVTATVDLIARTERIGVVLSPEGTRKRVERWRTGFYWIADRAAVPILPIAFDYSRKEIRIFPLFRTTGEIERDLPAIQRCYTREMARYPEQFGP